MKSLRLGVWAGVVGSVVASAPTLPPTRPPETQCGAWVNGYSLTGTDITFQITDSAAACCRLCGEGGTTPKCTAWTWNLGDHRCYLKDGIKSNSSEPCVSGYIGSGPPLPYPPAPSGPACGVDPPSGPSDPPQCQWYKSSATLADRRDALVAALTTEEKLAVLAGRGVDRVHLVNDGFNEALHGVAWTGRATVFPCPMSLASTWNASLLNSIGKVVTYEALAKHYGDHSNALGFFAPNINIVRDVRWGRAQETYGEDPTLTGTLGASYVNGMQFPNASWPTPAVRNVAKHFAAYNLESNFAGRTTPEEIAAGDGQYRLSYNANVSDADLLQTFLPAFEDLVQTAHLRGVMCAYNAVNGVPLCANTLMKEQLRGRMGFEGFVITDCGAIGFMTSDHHWAHPDGTPYSPVEATAASLAAGTDLNCGDAYGSQLPAALSQGLITKSQLDTATGRVVYSLLELGVMSDTATAAGDPRKKVPMSVVDSAPHRALAKEAAVQSVVLLKNSNNTLPLGGRDVLMPTIPRTLGTGSPINVGVVGPNANRTLTLTSNYAGCKDRPGGPIISSCTFVNPLEGIQAAVRASGAFSDTVGYADGVDIDTNDTSRIADAVAVAKASDVVVIIGGLITCQETGDECQEAEARDRSTPVDSDGTDNPFSHADLGRDYGIGLPGSQLDLVKAIATSTKTPIVLVIMSGSAVAVPWAASSPRVGAIVQHFYAGVLGGEALADVLFGKAAPGGKLPVMVPTSEDQLPVDYLDQSMQAPPGRTHRYFTGTPLYQFAHGLGYSTFTYSDLAISRDTLAAGQHDLDTTVTVTVSVRNNGEFSAASSPEVVLVYAVPDLDSSATEGMSVPRQMLLGFTKIHVAPLEMTTARVEVSARKLRLAGSNGVFELLQGRFALHVSGRVPAPQVAATHAQQPLQATLHVLAPPNTST